MGFKEVIGKTAIGKKMKQRAEDASLREELRKEILAENKDELKAALKKELIEEEKARILKKDGKGKSFLEKLGDEFATVGKNSDSKIDSIMGKGTVGKSLKQQRRQITPEDKDYAKMLWDRGSK